MKKFLASRLKQIQQLFPLLGILWAMMWISMPVFVLYNPVYASYSYYAPIQIYNNSTNVYAGIPILVTLNNTQLYNLGYINSTGLDTDVTLSGSSQPYMVGTSRLGIVATSLGSFQTNTYSYQLRNNPQQSDYPLVVGYGGNVTIASNLTAGGIGNNFTVEQQGYVNTSNATSAYLAYKRSSFGTYVSPAGNITSSLYYGYPIVVSTNGTTIAATTTPQVGLPPSIVAGNLLVVIFVAASTPVISWPTGWNGTNTLFSANAAATSANMSCAYKVATGTEGGAITLALSASQKSCFISYQISNYTGIPVAGTAVAASTANPNPPSLTPSFSDVNSTLWIAMMGNDSGAADGHVDAYPSGYTGGLTYGTGVSNPIVGSAQKASVALTEDPGTFTLNAGSNTVSNTVAIQGGGSSTVVSVSGVVASGNHTIKTTADTTNLYLYVDDVLTATSALAGNTTLDTDSSWFFQNGQTLASMNYLKISVNGTQKLWWQPVTMVNGSAIDRSGNANNGTINYGTNPTGIVITPHAIVNSSSFISAVNETTAVGAVLPSPTDFNLTASNTSASHYTTLPLYDLVHRAADSLGFSDQAMYLIIGMIAATGVGFGALIGAGNMLAFALGFGVTGGLLISMGVIPIWVIFIVVAVLGMGYYTWKRG